MHAKALPLPPARPIIICRVYGEAYLLVNSDTGQKVVIKHVPLEYLDEDEVRIALNEVHALNALEHPNVVRCITSWIMPTLTYETGGDQPWTPGYEHARIPIDEALRVINDCLNDPIDKELPVTRSLSLCLNILTEYVDGGSLDTLIERNAPFDEELLCTWLAQIILGIEHMHSRNLLHRDIKPANIFITQSGLVKIGDLGCCKLLSQPDEKCTSDYGSPLYLSPEVWKEASCSHKSDIWAIGCVMYELLAQKPPFAAPELAYKVLHTDPPPLPERYSADLRKLILEMLSKDPEVRPSAAELLRKPSLGHYVQRWLAAAHSTVGS